MSNVNQTETENCKITRMPVGFVEANCYVVELEGNTCFIIDPGAEARKILALVSSLSCVGILCTHTHLDHIGAMAKVAKGTGAPIFLTSEQRQILSGSSVSGFAARLGAFLVSKLRSDEHKECGNKLDFGGFEISVLKTPGHTSDSISFLCEAGVFTGDLLFRHGVGGTYLKGSSLEELRHSVVTEIFPLGDDTIVFPGHGPETTIGEERRNNPFL
ncbi:MAG: MBL fold metallo-hydrolase [Actinomycetota bacterium]|nr:MBL fold metallo-hydrolase [Actinomycetota bacterium]